MINELKTLYSVFDLLNGEEISHSPSMSNTQLTDYSKFLKILKKWIQGTPINKWTLNKMQNELKNINHCYYQPHKLKTVIRINNCPYIELCNKLMEEIEDVD